MGLDVWFREDVARVLEAASVAGREARLGPVLRQPEGSGEGTVLSQEAVAFWHGYQAALATIGAAFGLKLAGGAALPVRCWELDETGRQL